MLVACGYLLAVVVQQAPPAQSGQGPNSQHPDPASQQQQDVVHHEGEKGLTPPKATYMANPDYPEKSRKAGVRGIVGVQAVVTSEGKVGDVSITKKLDPDLDEKAVEAVRKWTFKPAIKDGRPVAAQINVHIQFGFD